MSSRPWRLPLLLFVGSLLMQAAWCLALPPFRGSDEFDHAYRAAAVARGELRPDWIQATDGRGDLVTAPLDVVEAAEPICSTYEYTGPDNCHSVADKGDGMVTVASGAARYNPAFYWVVGTVARPFDGYAALYAMRLAGMVMCASLIALAGWCVSRWSTTRWPSVGVAAAMSPVAVYSTTVAAPNGAEICAGLALWSALLGLASRQLPTNVERGLLLAAAPAAAILATVRLLGVGWMGLITLCAVACMGFARLREVWTRNRGSLITFLVISCIAAAGAIGWVLMSSQNTREPEPVDAEPFTEIAQRIPLWVLQSIAAFPLRNERAPTVVYTLVFLTFVTFVVLALRVASTRLRAILGVSLVLAVAIPSMATYSTFEAGVIWQGRYGLPFAVGLPVLAGFILDRYQWRHRLAAFGVRAGWLALAIAHTVSVLFVLRLETRESPLSGSSGWLSHPTWLVTALMLAGWWLYGLASSVTSLSNRTGTSSDGSVPDVSRVLESSANH